MLSEDYLQKVASIGVRKKRSSHQHHSFGTSSDKKERSNDVLKVVKIIRRDKNHNPSKENLLHQQKTNNRLRIVVHGGDGLFETYRLSKSQFDGEDVTFNSRISVTIIKNIGLRRIAFFETYRLSKNCFAFPNYRGLPCSSWLKGV